MRILIIEDNPGDKELIAKALDVDRNGIDLHHEVRLRDALRRTDLAEFQVILADLSLPDSSGLNCVTQLHAAVPRSPIIVLTSLMSDTVAVDAIRHGAQDYVVKDHVNKDLLERSIRYAIQRQLMRSENDRLLTDLTESTKLLEKKNEKLERVCETSQQFVDNVSHEFRTPLTVIMEYASIIQDGVVGDVNDEQRRLLNVVGDRTNDLNNMVDDMLDFSRMEAGLLGIARSTCDIESVVEHVLPSLNRKADVRGVRIESEVAENLPMIYCDAEKIGRIMVNLIGNAIKFAGDPGLVRVEVDRCGEHDLVVSVRDNGQGIPPEQMDEIFGRFSQVHADVRQSTKGFGLGLNIAQNLVDLNFGRMSVESSVGQGSNFKFTIPLADMTEVTRRYLVWLESHRDAADFVSAIHIEKELDDGTDDEIDAFLRYVLRPNDLVFRRKKGQWLLLINTPKIELHTFLERIMKEYEFFSRNRPLGQLPEFEMSVKASWRLRGDADQLLSFLAASSGLVCHA